MQISGVSLTLTWPCRLCLLRVLLCTTTTATSFPLSKHTGEVTLHPLSLACCLFTAHVGSGSSPLSCGVFLPPPLLQAFQLLVAGCSPTLRPDPAFLLTVPGRIPLPPFRSSGRPTLFATCLYCSYCLLLSFSFFPGWRSVCPGGYAVLAQGCLWEYCIPLSSPCLHLPKPSGHGQLLAQGPSWFLRLI
jgi:hypothetical protein